MSVTTRLAAFAVAGGVAFGGGAVLGAAIGPEPSSATRDHDAPHESPTTTNPTNSTAPRDGHAHASDGGGA